MRNLCRSRSFTHRSVRIGPRAPRVSLDLDLRKIIINRETARAYIKYVPHALYRTRFPRPLIYLFLINRPTLIFELVRSHREPNVSAQMELVIVRGLPSKKNFSDVCALGIRSTCTHTHTQYLSFNLDLFLMTV